MPIESTPSQPRKRAGNLSFFILMPKSNLDGRPPAVPPPHGVDDVGDLVEWFGNAVLTGRIGDYPCALMAVNTDKRHLRFLVDEMIDRLDRWAETGDLPASPLHLS